LPALPRYIDLPPVQIAAGTPCGTPVSFAAVEKLCCDPVPVLINLSLNTTVTLHPSEYAARSAVLKGSHRDILPEDTSPVPPGLWADGRTFCCITLPFLHTQRTSPAPLPVSAKNVPPGLNPLW